MVESLLQIAAQAEEAWEPIAFRAVSAAFALAAAALGLGMIGASYMKALGRNPEARKVAGQIVIIAAMVEVTALLVFLLTAFLLS